MRLNEQDLTISEGVSNAFFALNADWEFTFVSVQAERLLNRASGDLLGKNIWQEYPDAIGGIYDEKYHRAFADQTPVSFNAFFARQDAWFEFRAFPSPDGLSIYFRDVSREYRTAQALKDTENRLALAMESAGVGWFTSDLVTGDLLWSDRSKEIHGIPQDAEITLAGFVQMIHPDDRDWVTQSVRESIADRTDYEAEFRALKPDGTLVWISSRGRPRINAEGITVSFEGIIRDITEQKQTAEALEEERRRVLERERNIAEVLQTAVQPELPRIVPGLDLAFFFKAALDEANIGGDFADVFAVDHGRTALVIGDLSGKGLAAASQVATVRNMLRSFIYSEPTLVQAVTKLNRIVVEKDLLNGFVTLFAATYRAGDRSLRFVSTGHEPGLIRRAGTGVIEELAPTGTVLGADEDAVYTEQGVMLTQGDALLLYTDGLSESGVSFREFLGVDGMIRLFATSQGTDSAALMSEIIGGVQHHAEGNLRDDACLLVAVAQ
jgi:PAS domain S-box-containing protein